MQRLTGIALIPLSLWFVYCLLGLSHSNYNEVRVWVGSPAGVIGLTFFLSAAGYHSYLGMQVIFEDYIHCPALRLVKRISLLFLTFAATAVGLFSILRQAF